MENPEEITAEQIVDIYKDAPASAQDEGEDLIILTEEEA